MTKNDPVSHLPAVERMPAVGEPFCTFVGGPNFSEQDATATSGVRNKRESRPREACTRGRRHAIHACGGWKLGCTVEHERTCTDSYLSRRMLFRWPVTARLGKECVMGNSQEKPPAPKWRQGSLEHPYAYLWPSMASEQVYQGTPVVSTSGVAPTR